MQALVQLLITIFTFLSVDGVMVLSQVGVVVGNECNIKHCQVVLSLALFVLAKLHVFQP